MKKAYITPQATEFGVSPTTMLNVSLQVFDSNTGGDDGEGGYDPSSSLTKEQKSIWD